MPVSPLIVVLAVAAGLTLYGAVGVYHGALKVVHKVEHVMKHGVRKQKPKPQPQPPSGMAAHPERTDEDPGINHDDFRDGPTITILTLDDLVKIKLELETRLNACETTGDCAVLRLLYSEYRDFLNSILNKSLR